MKSENISNQNQDITINECKNGFVVARAVKDGCVKSTVLFSRNSVDPASTIVERGNVGYWFMSLLAVMGLVGLFRRISR
jgi:hypothetical protein